MTQSLIDKKLKEVNQRLRQANTGVTLIQKGNSLYARGTFPPKPGSAKTEPHQQEIALKVKAHPAGLKVAEAKAKKIGTEMVLKEFDWANYSTRPLSTAETKTVADWLREFEMDYFQRRRRTPKSEATWRSAYHHYLKRLPPEERLTTDLLNQTIRKTTPDSSIRSAICLSYKALGKFAGLEMEFVNALRGTYSSMHPRKRDLPSDETIVGAILQLKSPWWRWATGMLATYGLRPHEVFHLDTQAMESGQSIAIKVLPNTKTGARTVMPLYPEWIEQFNLRDRQSSKISRRDNSALGAAVGTHFRSKGMPFRPYDLRHCWAVRALRFGVPVSLAARWMGHSVEIHTKTYQAWISEEMETQVYEKSLQNPNRPQAPLVKQVEVDAKAQQNLGARPLEFNSGSKQETAEPQSSELQGCLSETGMRGQPTPFAFQSQATLAMIQGDVAEAIAEECLVSA
ncbi:MULTISPECIES: site-specific integrase [Leptolyngbya]|uniref:site-specific integrase n=1 Tax=Leptolyngbya TaxID=47251 RepID=UPI0016899E82|nr:site-specific integrase [Leptolyngbya sp. FACHB-1624]MBD1860027.1 site-specific integrase [Leptolyngbya sp. FACHB-1624]